MREHRRVDRFAGIPFSSGCSCHSSVEVVGIRPKKCAHGAATTPPPPPCRGCEVSRHGKPKGESFVSRLLKSFKNLSQIFVLFEEEEEDEEEEEREMVIGLPTDVKHVAHIGWDGSTDTAGSMKQGWDRAARGTPAPAPAPASSSLPAFSVRQLELAMAAQAGGAALAL